MYDEPGSCAPPKRVERTVLVCSFLKELNALADRCCPSNARISLDIAATLIDYLRLTGFFGRMSSREY